MIMFLLYVFEVRGALLKKIDFFHFFTVLDNLGRHPEDTNIGMIYHWKKFELIWIRFNDLFWHVFFFFNMPQKAFFSSRY